MPWKCAEKVSHRRWHITAVAGDAVKAYGMPWFATKHVYAMQEPGNWIFDFDAVAPGRSTVRCFALKKASILA